MHFGSLEFFSVWKETETRGKCNKFTNSSLALDQSKPTIDLNIPSMFITLKDSNDILQAPEPDQQNHKMD